MMTNSKTEESLTRKEEAVNVVRGILKGIPYLGDSLDQLLFGRLEELRMNRIESTLTEIAELVKRSGHAPRVDSEEFGNLLEKILPQLARATSSENRERLRDLLLNASALPPESADWEKANLAALLLAELRPPALAIIACVARFQGSEPVAIVSRPKAQVVSETDFSWDSPVLGSFLIGFDWPVVEEWARRLREMRLLGYNSSDARGGFGGLALTDLGRMLVEWTVGQREVA